MKHLFLYEGVNGHGRRPGRVEEEEEEEEEDEEEEGEEVRGDLSESRLSDSDRFASTLTFFSFLPPSFTCNITPVSALWMVRLTHLRSSSASAADIKLKQKRVLMDGDEQDGPRPATHVNAGHVC